FAARAAGASTDAARDAMNRVGLERPADIGHARLSAGQRRAGALARALARDPKLFLLDEPHAGLDAESRVVVDALLENAAAEGRTVVVASHELDRLRPLVAREVVLTAGQAHGAAAPDAGPAPRKKVRA